MSDNTDESLVPKVILGSVGEVEFHTFADEEYVEASFFGEDGLRNDIVIPNSDVKLDLQLGINDAFRECDIDIPAEDITAMEVAIKTLPNTPKIITRRTDKF